MLSTMSTMSNSSIACAVKGAFCEVYTDKYMRKNQSRASANLECLGWYGSPCEVNSDCAQADAGLMACMKGFCNCTALYRVSTRGVCVSDITLPGSMLLLSGSVYVLLICMIAMLLTGVFALYSYDYRLEMNLQKLDLIQEISRRGRDQADSIHLPPAKGPDHLSTSPRRKAAPYLITDRPNWKRFRNQFISSELSPRKPEKAKLGRPEAKAMTKSVSKDAPRSHDGVVRVALGNLIKDAVETNAIFAYDVGRNVAQSVGLRGAHGKSLAYMVQKALDEESGLCALEYGDWTLL